MALLVFLFVLVTHMQFPIHQTVGDSIWYLPTAFSMLNEGNLDLTEYQALIDQNPSLDYTITEVDGKPYNTYPIGPTFVALPFVAVVEGATKILNSVDLYALSKQSILLDLDMFVACVTVAGAVMFIYLTTRLFLPNHLSLLIAFIIAFCTTALSTASRGLWQHGPSMLMLAATIYALLRASRSDKFLILAGFCLAFAYIIRPTNSLSVIILSLYVLISFRQKIVLFLLGAVIIALPFFYANYTVYSSPFAPYFFSRFAASFNTETIFEGLAGTLISPARGLFIFSPVLLLSLVGVVIKLRGRSMIRLDVCLVLIIVFHWVLISSIRDWKGGFSYGPRYMTDILPYLAFFLIPFFARLPAWPTATVRLATGFLVVTMLISLVIHVRGAADFRTQQWNSLPVNVDEFPERVWDWSDLQFLRGWDVIGDGSGSGPSSHIRLEFDSDSLAYEGVGWGNPETSPDGKSFQWMVDKQATLNLRLAADQPLEVRVSILSAILPDLLKTFRFEVNGYPIALQPDGAVYSGIILTSALNANAADELRFTVNFVASPKLLGLGDDPRLLGLMLDWIEIQPLKTATQ